ncbi:hypothetical protein [Chryseobacterium echinoideorum]|uniref:hypothetical protein n=1 Tax=Chryseobacterium echinoideorum TaxID=1549648 RepID=UPI001184CC42|nr:hypothetical protein [Chryseobacterium echinoideorum]
MKNKYKGINTILAMSIWCCSVGLVSAQTGQTGVGTRNPQGALHVDGAKDNDATAPTAPTATQAANDVIVDKTTGFIGVGVSAPTIPLDMRSTVNTDNALGIGTTTMTAAAAAAGAVRYDEVNVPVGAKIEVSDGSVWNKLYVAPQKAVVVARKISTKAIGTSATVIDGWNEIYDLSNSFTPATGVFMAPRAGTYTFLLTFNLVNTVIADATRVESQFYKTSGTPAILARVYKTFAQSMTGTPDDANASKQTQAGGSSTVTLTLAQGDTVVPRLLHNLTGGNINLRVTTNSSDPANPDDGFNNLTIIEH